LNPFNNGNFGNLNLIRDKDEGQENNSSDSDNNNNGGGFGLDEVMQMESIGR
jgi:hypothetical protein